ncbi:hypothetical protein Tco_1382438, partial [Tanacetum coccineum]
VFRRLWWLIRHPQPATAAAAAGKAAAVVMVPAVVRRRGGGEGGKGGCEGGAVGEDPTIALGSRAEGSPFEPSLGDSTLVSESSLYVGIRVHKAEQEQIKHLEFTTRACVGFIRNIR